MSASLLLLDVGLATVPTGKEDSSPHCVSSTACPGNSFPGLKAHPPGEGQVPGRREGGREQVNSLTVAFPAICMS